MNTLLVLALAIASAVAFPAAPRADYGAALRSVQQIKFVLATHRSQVNRIAIADKVDAGVAIATKLLEASVDAERTVINKMELQLIRQTLTADEATQFLATLEAKSNEAEASISPELSLLSETSQDAINIEFSVGLQEAQVHGSNIIVALSEEKQ